MKTDAEHDLAVPRPCGSRDLLWAACFALAAALLYRLSAQERFANDGPQLASVFVLVPDAVHWQILYLPLARLLGRLVAWGDPFEPLRMVGALGGGLGVGASFLFARGLEIERRCAAGAACLLGVSQHAWFFGSSIEVHSLHFGMVAAAACATWFAPWRRPALALAIAAAAFALTWTTHGTAVLLGPGWVLLCAAARARQAPPFRAATLLFVVGPVLLGALLAVMIPLKRWWAESTGGRSDVEWSIILGYAANTDRTRFLWEGLVQPLGLLLPVALVGAVLGWRDGNVRMLVALVAPGTAFLVWWGVPEDGGYFLGHAPFHAALAGFALAALGRAGALVAGGAVLAQAALSWIWLARFDSRFLPDDRVALARETLGEHGYLGKLAYLAPDISIWLAGVEEVDLTGRLLEGHSAGIDAAELARGAVGVIEASLALGPVALDISYESASWDLAGRGFVDYVNEFVAALLECFEVECFSRGTWTFARLRPRA